MHATFHDQRDHHHYQGSAYADATPVATHVQSGPSGQAIAALVLGVIGLVTGLVLASPVAWFLGQRELNDIRDGLAPPSGETAAWVGVVTGALGTVLLVLPVVILLVLGVGFAFALLAA